MRESGSKQASTRAKITRSPAVMHEYSIVQALLDRVAMEARSHGAVAVHRIKVQIGELSGVEIELLETAFDLARTSTVCNSAELEVVPVPASWQCEVCGSKVDRGQILRCDHCHRPAKLVAGDEIILERIEMEAA